MKVLQSLVESGVLTQDQVTALAEGIASKIDEKVEMNVIAMKDKLIAEERVKYEAEANEFLAEQYKIAEDEIAKKDKVIDELTAKVADQDGQITEALKTLETKLTTALSTYIDESIASELKDSLIEKVAKFENQESLIESMKTLFVGNYVNLDTEVQAMKESLEKEKASLVENNSALQTKNAELKLESDKLKKGLVILAESEDLNDSEKTKMLKFFENKSLDETKESIGEFKNLLVENSIDTLRKSFKKEQEKSVQTSNRPIRDSRRKIEVSLDEARSIEVITKSVDSVLGNNSEVSKQYETLNTLL